MKFLGIFLILAALIFVGMIVWAYSLTSTPSLILIGRPEARSSRGTAINDNDQVVGEFEAPGAYNGGLYTLTHAFVYSGGQMKDLGTLGGAKSQAFAISPLGQIVGASDIANGANHPFLYSGGKMTDLGDCGGKGGEAYAINDNGQIVGGARFQGEGRAFLYANGQISLLGTAKDDFFRVCGINRAGQMAGYDGNYGDNRAVLFADGVLTKLGTLGGGFSSATAINDMGQIVGHSTTAEGKMDAFLYTEGKMINLGNLGGRSYATCINNKGDVAGDTDGNCFLYTPQRGMQDMTKFCSKLLVEEKPGNKGFASLFHIGGINNQVDMTGFGYYWDGTRASMQAFLYRSGDNSFARAVTFDSYCGLAIVAVLLVLSGFLKKND